MKNGEIILIAQPLLESRTCAYLEWLANEVIMTANKTWLNDLLLVMLFANKKETINLYCLSTPWSQKNIPTSLVNLASTLCTQGLFYPIAGAAWGVSSCVEDSSVGHRWIRVSFPLDDYYIPLFNYRTLTSGIVINNFQDSMLYEMD